jgi:A/G-specific adenine glycosylase
LGSSPLTAEGLSLVRAWFRAEARAYPWSLTEDSYAVWISEVMLQQTVVTAAVAPYRSWMDRWPDLGALARADEAEVLRAWEGLGYASRAKNLHRTAQILLSQGKATLPDDETALRTLPGVGDYTASAILSFAYHRPALTLDANLKRVFQRLDGEPGWTPVVEARWRQVWAGLVDGPASRESNQAVMQLGQRVCRARGPSCGVCPLAPGCQARAQGLTDRIPAPKERQVIEKSTTVVFWERSGAAPEYWLARPLVGRFSNLWLVPPAGLSPIEPGAGARRLAGRVHTYTKYRDRLTPWVATWSGAGDPPLPEGWTGRWVTLEAARELGMVSVYRKILDEIAGGSLL